MNKYTVIVVERLTEKALSSTFVTPQGDKTTLNKYLNTKLEVESIERSMLTDTTGK